MKMCIKRVFCPVCQKMARCHEQKVEHNVQVVCTKGHSLRMWNGVRWRVLTETA